MDFQYGGHGGHLGFSVGMILAIFDLQVAPILAIKFLVNWPFGLRRRLSKYIFRTASVSHLGFPIGMI